MREEISMIACRLATIAIVGAVSVLVGADRAQARSPYDGSWSVVVSGQSGSCQGGSYSYALQIVNGIVHYSGGDARITGRVSRKGAVYVRVSSSDRSAVGSGRLARNSGAGDVPRPLVVRDVRGILERPAHRRLGLRRGHDAAATVPAPRRRGRLRRTGAL
jgi:hypothetical protein